MIGRVKTQKPETNKANFPSILLPKEFNNITKPIEGSVIEKKFNSVTEVVRQILPTHWYPYWY